MATTKQKQLLSVIEIGGYPNFTPLYNSLGYDVAVQTTMRKVLKYLKKNEPNVVVAEFNFQSDFRDRTSSLESMMSMVERYPDTKVIVFYDREFVLQLQRLQERYTFDGVLPFPIEEAELKSVFEGLAE